MIEPYITEKQCKVCGECKPLTGFYQRADAAGGYKPECKVCSSRREARRYHERKASGRIRSRNVGRVEPLWPLPTHTLADSLSCITLRKWRGPVEPGQLRYAL